MDSEEMGIGSAAIKIIVAIVLGFLILAVSSAITFLRTHTTMLLLSLILMFILSKGNVTAYGLKITGNLRLKQTLLVGFLAGLIINILGLALQIEEPSFLKDYTFLQAVVFIWIYASICEEVLTRGLIQGYLSPLRRYGFSIFNFRVSLPVLVAALFFGAMHLGLLTLGLDGFSVLAIVISAFIMGIIAGYYREKTESIVPAILIHMVFNISGSIIGFLENLI